MSFCIQTKTAASFSEVISCAFFGSSWSSDTALQVTCIVRRQMLSKFILFGCCYLFLPHSRLCFFFPPCRFSFPTLEERNTSLFQQWASALPDKCPKFSQLLSKASTRAFPVSHCNEPNPQPESAAVGSVTAISPFSKRVRRSACFLS